MIEGNPLQNYYGSASTSKQDIAPIILENFSDKLINLLQNFTYTNLSQEAQLQISHVLEIYISLIKSFIPLKLAEQLFESSMGLPQKLSEC